MREEEEKDEEVEDEEVREEEEEEERGTGATAARISDDSGAAQRCQLSAADVGKLGVQEDDAYSYHVAELHQACMAGSANPSLPSFRRGGTDQKTESFDGDTSGHRLLEASRDEGSDVPDNDFFPVEGQLQQEAPTSPLAVAVDLSDEERQCLGASALLRPITFVPLLSSSAERQDASAVRLSSSDFRPATTKRHLLSSPASFSSPPSLSSSRWFPNRVASELMGWRGVSVLHDVCVGPFVIPFAIDLFSLSRSVASPPPPSQLSPPPGSSRRHGRSAAAASPRPRPDVVDEAPRSPRAIVGVGRRSELYEKRSEGEAAPPSFSSSSSSTSSLLPPTSLEGGGEEPSPPPVFGPSSHLLVELLWADYDFFAVDPQLRCFERPPDGDFLSRNGIAAAAAAAPQASLHRNAGGGSASQPMVNSLRYAELQLLRRWGWNVICLEEKQWRELERLDDCCEAGDDGGKYDDTAAFSSGAAAGGGGGGGRGGLSGQGGSGLVEGDVDDVDDTSEQPPLSYRKLHILKLISDLHRRKAMEEEGEEEEGEEEEGEAKGEAKGEGKGEEKEEHWEGGAEAQGSVPRSQGGTTTARRRGECGLL